MTESDLNELFWIIISGTTMITGRNFLDYANSTNKSIAGFNSLIDGFKTGTNGGSAYNSYDETHIDSFGGVIVDNIVN